MNVRKIQERMNELHYWDARVKSLNCNHFADEVVLTYEDTDYNVVYKFYGCYKVSFDHSINYTKDLPVKELKTSQLPYFIQDVALEEVEENGVKLYKCQISMPPMNLGIWCNQIEINKV
jgi:hypothetical protein